MLVGVVGQGSFGRFTAKMLAQDKGLEVLACDVSQQVAAPAGVRLTSLQEVAGADVAILCVPLVSYREVLAAVRPQLSLETLVIDICSVKLEAEKRLRAGLPGHQNLLITHPMFGPQTADDGLAGKTLVVTASEGKLAEQAVRYCDQKWGLKIMRMTSEAHDRAMADVHALTFFIARGLTNFGLQESKFHAPSFQSLLNLMNLDKVHSEDLYRTIELGNPYAKESRENFVKTLQDINNQLEKETV